jgi:hypothetical protein
MCNNKQQARICNFSFSFFGPIDPSSPLIQHFDNFVEKACETQE